MIDKNRVMIIQPDSRVGSCVYKAGRHLINCEVVREGDLISVYMTDHLLNGMSQDGIDEIAEAVAKKLKVE